MKKIISIAFAAILAGFAISCQKEEAVSDKTDAVQYTFNIVVSDQAGFDNDASTKGGDPVTYKTEWEDKDRIFLFFKPDGRNLLDDTYATLTYNGSSWDVTVTPKQSSLGDGGTLSAVYVYNLDSSVDPEFSDNKWTIATGNTFYNCQTGVLYTVSGSNKISARLVLEAPANFVRFSVYSASGALTCDKVKGWKDIAIGSDLAVSNVTCTGYMTGFDNIGNSSYKDYYGRIVSGETSLNGKACNFSVVKNGKVYEHAATPLTDKRSFTMTSWTEAPGKLPGLFTVGEGADGKAGTADDVKVRFSQGNLWAKQSPDKDELYFEENQYSSKSDWEASHVSLLTWSSTAREAANIGYSGENLFCDVNHKVSVDGSEAIYYALSLDEWTHLFNTRSNASSLYKCGVTVCGKANCVVLLPDGWQWGGNVGTDWQKNTSDVVEYNEEMTINWSTMEAAGAVCLPAAGYRRETSFSYEGYYGYYWSSNNNEYIERQAYLGVKFDSSNVGLGDPEERDSGYSIRLVTEVK